MFKRTGIGFTCLAFAFAAYCGSGTSKASVIDTCDNGKSHDVCKDDKGGKDGGKIDFKVDDKDYCKGDKQCDIFDHGKGDDNYKNYECVINWIKDCQHNDKGDCDPDKGCNNNPPHCDPTPCQPDPCHGDGCASVPTPSASLMGGFGVVGVMIASWLRGRRYASTNS
jgi:hypothetical protein